MQLSLPIATSAPAPPQEEVDAFCEFLHGRNWCTALQISRIYPRWGDRKLRKLAESSEGRVMSSDAGYKLTLEGNFEEVHHASGRLISQGKSMIRRGIKIQRVYHEGHK